jgi:hypothetical protein
MDTAQVAGTSFVCPRRSADCSGESRPGELRGLFTVDDVVLLPSSSFHGRVQGTGNKAPVAVAVCLPGNPLLDRSPEGQTEMRDTVKILTAARTAFPPANAPLPAGRSRHSC